MKYLTDKEAAERWGCSLRHMRRMCQAGELPGARKRQGCWEIPETAHPKLAEPAKVAKIADSQELAGLPARKRDKAIHHLGIVQEFERFAGQWQREGGTQGDAMVMFCKMNPGVSRRSLERWPKRFREEGLEGLVDMRGAGGFLADAISAEAFEHFKSLYLTQQRLSVKQCRQMTLFESKDKHLGWRMPSLRSMYRLVKDSVPLPAQVLHREGLAAYEARCAPYIETDLEQIEPGSVWIGDHSPLNCWIRHRGRWVRPWITCWMDMRSRAIVGRDINASPNQTTIMLAAKRGLERYGPPESVKVDNGKDYDSEMWTGTTKVRRRMLQKGYLDEQMTAGLYAMMDIAVSFAIKYYPQSKAVERLFDTIDRQFTKTIPTYCGKNTDQKPDYINDMLKSDKAIKEAYGLESFAAMLDKYIDVYNNSAHSGRGVDGQTPLQVLSQRASRRVMAAGVLELMMRVWSGELIVGKNGVRFKRMWYGQYDIELLAHQGKKVRVAYDSDDLSKVWVYDATTMRWFAWPSRHD